MSETYNQNEVEKVAEILEPILDNEREIIHIWRTYFTQGHLKELAQLLSDPL